MNYHRSRCESTPARLLARCTSWALAVLMCVPLGCSPGASDNSRDSREASAGKRSNATSTDDAVDFSDPSAIIARAIKVHGGRTAIEGIRKGRIRQTFNMGSLPPTTWVDLFELPDKHRRDVYSELKGKASHLTRLTIGSQAQSIFDDGHVEQDLVLLSWDSIYPLSFFSRLLKFEANDCSLAPSSRTCDHDGCVGIRAGKPDGSEILAFFDRSSGYLVAIEESVPHLDFVKTDLAIRRKGLQTTRYSDFRRVGRLVVPYCQVSYFEGAEESRIGLQEFKALDQLPQDAFVKPENVK